MSNKAHTSLDHSDLALRMASPVGMDSGVKQVIFRVAGFELFNTRPYHNYETWSDGYRVVGRKDRQAMTYEEVALILKGTLEQTAPYIDVQAEDMDDACALFSARLKSVETSV